MDSWETTTPKNKDSEEKKATNEKSVSLSLLNFKEALAALLKVKPKSKEEKTSD